MLKYNFKDKYINRNGENVENQYGTYFFSPTCVEGNGTRLSPYRSNTISLDSRNSFVFSGGIHKLGIVQLSNGSKTKYINGNGINNTYLSGIINFGGNSGQNTINLFFKDLNVREFSFAVGGSSTWVMNLNLNFDYVCFNNPINNTILGNYINYYIGRCLLKSLATSIVSGTLKSITYHNNNSFIDITTSIGSITGDNHTWEKCNLIVNQASLDNCKNNFYAFDNCNFRIGSETIYTPLTGTTAEQLRTAFVNRCTAQGLNVEDVDAEGITLPLGRWIFTKNQIFEGITWKGSEIDLFEVPRFISLGYSSSRGDKIAISTVSNMPASFAPEYSNSPGLDFAADSLSIGSTIDITKRNNLYSDSKIIWLGGKKKLTNIDIPHNLPANFGVLLDSIPNLGEKVDIIEPDEMYMVRSTNVNIASVTYAGSTYTSALNTRNNIFKGVSDITKFEGSDNAVVYKINDTLNYQSIPMRVVNKIPPGNITSGNLIAGYWYFVEHDNDQTNTTDYVTYNGVNYKTTDSFLVKPGALTFTIPAGMKIHLRRCWKQDFDVNTETTDKVFWQNEQKPEWCDILPEDPRCQMKLNSEKSIEMARGEDGKYITSGHPEYYNKVLGTSGVFWPNDIYIQGTFIQIRLPITTANPM